MSLDPLAKRFPFAMMAAALVERSIATNPEWTAARRLQNSCSSARADMTAMIGVDGIIAGFRAGDIP